MPTEVRIITFSEWEMKEALIDFCIKSARPLPDDSFDAIEFPCKGEVNVTVVGRQNKSRLTFQEHEVAAAIIGYCVKKNIPIARRSLKSLRSTRHSVSLRLQTARRSEIGVRDPRALQRLEQR